MKSVILRDDAAIKTMDAKVKRMVAAASDLAEVWNKQSIMGVMSKKEFALLLSGGVPYFMEAFRESIRRDEARLRGEVYYHLADVTKYSPMPIGGDVNFDARKLGRMIESANDNRYRVDWSIIDFNKSGEPYISKATKDWIDDQYTIYGTDENMAVYEDGEKDAAILNEMIAKGHDITVGEPFILMDGRYSFNPKTLKYGSGAKPPKAVDAVYEPPEVDDDGALSPYQPANASNTVRRRSPV